MEPSDSQIIDNIGGTVFVARECRISKGAVSQWRRTGIPDARRDFLRLKFPDAFSGINQATAPTENREAA